MKSKKLITSMLVIVIFTLQFSFVQFSNVVYANEIQNSEKYHYKQLTAEAKNIYNAMYEMYTKGILKTGTQSYDLVENGYITQEQLEKYSNGSKTLTTAMNAARYAFYADYPEIFYVNSRKFTLRVTKDADNKYHANIGSGNYKNYYIDGITTENIEEAEREFNNIVNEIAEKAKNLEIEEGKNKQTEQIKYVHNQITKNTSYRLEGDCTPGNEGFINTPYGALVKKQAICEGYARALKTILDKVGINCILVQGLHQSEGSAAVEHMWNYVEIEKETLARSTQKVWYAVDATLDDPYLRKTATTPDAFPEPGSDLVEGFENTRYCIVGRETMNKEHTPLEIVEAAGNYKFEYPEISSDDYGIDTVSNKDGLLVKYKQDGTETEEYKSGDYYISYDGKGYAKAAEQGRYILMKSYYYKPGDEEWQISPWAYFLPDVYAGGFRDYDDHIYVYVPNSEYVEFAVTTLAPGNYQENPKYLSYQGDESDFVAKTEKLYNPSGTYKGKPYIKEQTPAGTATIIVGPTYHVKVVYDDELVLEEGATEAGYRMESSGATGAQESEITNFRFDGKSTIEFDLKFSKMYADDGASYAIYITGLVGKNSGKAPMEILYGALNRIACSFSMNKAKNWEVFASPTLLENQDLSMNDWKTQDGKSVSDQLKSRIALVTTKTTEVQKDSMNNLMENELGNQKVVTSETYNISLNVCKKYVVKTGHRLRLSLGFPEGYGPDDAGVTFKAYHFIRNDKDEVIGVEEIPCVVTPLGLIVTCDSFSPYAIAVVENDENVKTKKYAVASADEGGVIEGADRENGNIFELSEENPQRVIKVKADEGNEIDTITVCGEVIDMSQVENKDEMDITVTYEDIKDGNGIINATFVAKTVAQEERAKGETVVIQQPVPVEIEMPKTELLATINRKVELTPTVTETEGTQTYQWFKDGVAIQGQTNKTLSIIPTVEDTGAYTLKVTTIAGTVTESVTSEPCNIVVRTFGISIENADETTNLQELQPGSEFEVDIEMNNLKNIENGLVSLTGQLEYDTNILERVEEKGQNGWNLSGAFNEQNFKFVIDSNELVKEQTDIFRIKFRVKQTIAQDIKSIIKIKGVSASGGNGLIVANDAEVEIGIKLKQEEEKITSEKYVINNEDKDISRIPPKTTVADFRQNVTTKQEMVFTDKEGNVLTDESIIGTGMTVKVGKTLQYTLVVTGDVDGDKLVTIDDLARIKLHLIDIEKLEGIELKAANVDNDNMISINDVAQVKLVIIGLFEIK